LAVLYSLVIWQGFIAAIEGASFSFGYADFQHQWRILNDFVNLKMPFVDYYHRASYGLFYMLIQSIPYITLGKTFYALLFVRNLYLPIVASLLSYLIAKNTLRKHSLIIIFLFFAYLFRSNNIYESPRHIIAELSLSFLILYFLTAKVRNLFICGIVAGLSIMTSFEYGMALNLTLVLVTLVFILIKGKKIIRVFGSFALGEGMVLGPYFIWMLIRGIFFKYWSFTIATISNFHFISPARMDSFPRLSDIHGVAFNLSSPVFMNFLQKLNLYFVFVFYVLIGLNSLLFIIRARVVSRTEMTKLCLAIYGLLIYVRTLDTPALGYFTYGLIPFFLLMAIQIDLIYQREIKKKRELARSWFLIGLIFLWFIFTQSAKPVIDLFNRTKIQTKPVQIEKILYPSAGMEIKSSLASDYRQISDYLIANTSKEDLVYVYSWGIYNFTSGRRSPVSDPLPGLFDEDRERIAKELAVRRPKYVVINIAANSGGALFGKLRGDIPRYYSLGYEDGPVFAGEGNVIEKFILENYFTVMHNESAIVMAQRQATVKINSGEEITYSWTPIVSDLKWSSQIKKIGKSIVFEEPKDAYTVAIKFKLDGDLLTKHFSRFVVVLNVSDEKGVLLGQSRMIATKSWQIEKVYLPDTRKIKKIDLDIESNNGLVWWLNPYRINIAEVHLYTKKD